MTCLP